MESLHQKNCHGVPLKVALLNCVSVTSPDAFKVKAFVLDFSTYRQQLLAFAGLAESQYAVQIDAGLCLVTVLNKAEGLKVEPGNLGKSIACHRRPLVH